MSGFKFYIFYFPCNQLTFYLLITVEPQYFEQSLITEKIIDSLISV